MPALTGSGHELKYWPADAAVKRKDCAAAYQGGNFLPVHRPRLRPAFVTVAPPFFSVTALSEITL